MCYCLFGDETWHKAFTLEQPVPCLQLLAQPVACLLCMHDSMSPAAQPLSHHVYCWQRQSLTVHPGVPSLRRVCNLTLHCYLNHLIQLGHLHVVHTECDAIKCAEFVSTSTPPGQGLYMQQKLCIELKQSSRQELTYTIAEQLSGCRLPRLCVLLKLTKGR